MSRREPHSLPGLSEDLYAPDDADTIGMRIRIARKAGSLNQGALARVLGVSQPTVANWESDVHNPRQLMLRKLADALNVSLGWLAGGEEVEKLSAGHPAAAYLSRPVMHVPVLPPDALLSRRVFGEEDLCCLAIDYVPFATNRQSVCGVNLTHSAKTEFPGDQLFIFDYRQKMPAPGGVALIATPDGPVLHNWSTSLDDQVSGEVLGTVTAALRFF